LPIAIGTPRVTDFVYRSNFPRCQPYCTDYWSMLPTPRPPINLRTTAVFWIDPGSPTVQIWRLSHRPCADSYAQAPNQPTTDDCRPLGRPPLPPLCGKWSQPHRPCADSWSRLHTLKPPISLPTTAVLCWYPHCLHCDKNGACFKGPCADGWPGHPRPRHPDSLPRRAALYNAVNCCPRAGPTSREHNAEGLQR